MEAYDLYYDDLKIQKSDIAPGFGSTGGGIQYENAITSRFIGRIRLN